MPAQGRHCSERFAGQEKLGRRSHPAAFQILLAAILLATEPRREPGLGEALGSCPLPTQPASGQQQEPSGNSAIAMFFPVVEIAEKVVVVVVVVVAAVVVVAGVAVMVETLILKQAPRWRLVRCTSPGFQAVKCMILVYGGFPKSVVPLWESLAYKGSSCLGVYVGPPLMEPPLELGYTHSEVSQTGLEILPVGLWGYRGF